ncbi:MULTISPECIES: tyrosine-type recombinase/integrase [unclassified Streptomyces]|uniref:tyrosine-type recombinase/integrase n=1 Tax=unclassified Streptomyces TaxID=2593676 RepID=UPI000DAE925E|nr:MULTISPECIES: tyrosine-type recombinase/integrase [unclassified Streptomyces]PZT75120.1 site-specific integrase [Streptomyces sp. AC1-42T]PZT81897.1 site-specific integrase [Streptomyces sp. AC1-42W]
MDTTYDVKFWKTSVYVGKKKTTHTVRWLLAGEEWRKPFATGPLAESFRSGLLSAARKGEAFSLSTGLPISHISQAASVTWYDFAVQFVDQLWERTSANNRKTVAKALTPVTIALLRSQPTAFKGVDVRRALREYAFNTLRRDKAPPEVTVILRWVQRNSLPMSAWEDDDAAETALRAARTKLDGTPVAASSVRRTRRVLNVLFEYAIKKKVLKGNPLPKGKGASATAAKTSSAVDKRSLLNSGQAAALLRWIRERPRGGQRLHTFFAAMYYAGARPEEVVAIDVGDVRLPAADTGDQWGELVLHTAHPEVGKQWTDTGEVRETRGLKGRAAGDTRTVPCRPALTRILRAHIEKEGLKPGDLLMQGEKGGDLAGSVIRRAWRRARKEVLTEYEFGTPLGRRVYDLRHTCLTGWLNAGVPPATVAEWAGNSVPVLLATYARCIDGQLDDLKQRIERAGELPGPAAGS